MSGQIHPVCPEAYNVLAIHDASNYEEALEYFKKAVEQGTLIKDKDDLKEALESKDLFSIPPTSLPPWPLWCRQHLEENGKI